MTCQKKNFTIWSSGIAWNSVIKSLVIFKYNKAFWWVGP